MSQKTDSGFDYKKLGILFFILLFVRLAIAAVMWPGADEAYYYVYTLHPALSYFDHPPMVAVVGGLIPKILQITTPLTLRMGPIILFSLAAYIFLLISRIYLSVRESIMATAVFIVVPMFFLSGTLLLPDAALILLWLAGVYYFKKTIDTPVLKNWVLLGVILGLGMLSKYTMGFLYIGALLFMLIDRKSRKLLLSPGPYITILVSMIVFLPVILWNIENSFVSFTFQSSRVGLGSFKLRYFYQFIGGQLGYLMPFFFFPAMIAVYKSALHLKEKDEFNNMIFCFGAVPVIFFILASMIKKVLPHWPLIGYLTLTLPVGKFYYNLYSKKKALFNIYSIGHTAIVGAVITLILLQIHTGILMNKELPEAGIMKKEKVRDISIDIIGWKELNRYINDKLIGKDFFLLTHKWYLGGQIAFAVKGKYPVLCFNDKKDIRGFGIWQDQEKYLGKDAIFICTSKYFTDPVKRYGEHFKDIEFLSAIPVERSGKTVKLIYVYRCRGLLKTYSED